MLADFFPFGAIVLSWGATYFVHSTCLLTAIWTLLRFHRTASHAVRETLWKIGLVGGVGTACAQMLLIPSGLFGELRFAVDRTGSPSAAAMAGASDANNSVGRSETGRSVDLEDLVQQTHDEQVTLAAEDQEFMIFHDNSVANSTALADELALDGAREASLAVMPRPATMSEIASTAEIWQRSTICVLSFAVGTAILAILFEIARCLWQTILLRRKLSYCSVVDVGLARRLLDELCRLVPHAPNVLLLSAPDDPEPAAFGVRQWTIVIPERAALDLAEDEMRALLAHELAHLVRGDSLWLCISRVVCSFLAFQPLNHLARREWQRAAEFLCDNWAVSRTRTPLALARCLAEVAGWRLSGQASGALLAATGRKPGLADRIERLLDARPAAESANERGERRRAVCGGVLVLGAVAWCVPRIELAIASPVSASDIDFEAARDKNAIELVFQENFEGVAAEENSARPQVAGTIASAAHDQPSESQVAPSALSVEMSALLKSIDDDLIRLERELMEMEVLLVKREPPFRVVQLAERLHVEIGRLKQRREALHTHWKKSAE